MQMRSPQELSSFNYEAGDQLYLVEVDGAKRCLELLSVLLNTERVKFFTQNFFYSRIKKTAKKARFIFTIIKNLAMPVKKRLIVVFPLEKLIFNNLTGIPLD